jgi:hypothetical protein
MVEVTILVAISKFEIELCIPCPYSYTDYLASFFSCCLYLLSHLSVFDVALAFLRSANTATL